MHERGIDIAAEFPKPWTDEIIQTADVVVTMGCGDACPIFPGRRYQDWVLDDPAAKTLPRSARSATTSKAASATSSPNSTSTPPDTGSNHRRHRAFVGSEREYATDTTSPSDYHRCSGL